MSGASPIRTRIASAPVRIAFALTLGIAIAIALLLLGLAKVPSSKQPDIWFEVAQAGVQLGVIVVLGGAVAAALRSVDAAREDRHRVHEYRVGIFHDLLAAYNGVKAARRTLRAFGFRSPALGSLSVEQVAEYRAQLRSLIDIQLSLEKVRRELKTRPTLFRDSEVLRDELGTVERYVHDLVKEWETNGVWIKEGTDATRLAELPELQAFLRRRDQSFHDNLHGPMERVQDTIGSQL